MNEEVRLKLEANRRRALERLKSRGILRDEQLAEIAKRNKPLVQLQLQSQQPRDDAATGGGLSAGNGNGNGSVDVPNSSQINTNTTTPTTTTENTQPQRKKLKPSIRTKDYIEYDFSTMENLNGGYINAKDNRNNSDYDYESSLSPSSSNKHAKSIEQWKEEQRQRRFLYENQPPPEHISQAQRCVECKVNIEMDPVLHDVFKLNVCKTCAKEHTEKYSLLTKTECKEDYFLTEPELNDTELFHRLEKPNPHSGTFARMQLFVRCEVERVAFEKWGGEEGLDNEWKRREELKLKRREKKYNEKIREMRLKTRAQEYTRRLQDKKYGNATHVHEFSEPVSLAGKDEDGNDILKRRCIICGLEVEEIDI